MTKRTGRERERLLLSERKERKNGLVQSTRSQSGGNEEHGISE